MSHKMKIGRNNPCPCLDTKKYKYCCEGKVDWPTLMQGAKGNPYAYSLPPIREIFDALGGELKAAASERTRNTILPRYMDSHSDVDYMVVFKDSGFRPQTYLERLRRFVERNYTRSQIKQSHPTIQLE